MSKSSPLSPIFQGLLAELRERLNTKFRKRVALGAKIDGPNWLRHVEQYIAPIVLSVHASAPDRSKETLLELYDIGLDLTALGHFNEIGGSLRVIELWREAFPAIAPVLSLNPRAVIGSLSNAVLYLNQASSTKTDTWLKQLMKLGPECRTVDQLLHLGKFLGWTSGFAHMRHAAIQIAANLPSDLLRSPIGLTDQASEQTVRHHLQELSVDPWANMSDKSQAPGITEVGRCGNFRGLEGEFLRPPKTFIFEGSLHVTDGQRRWKLHADRFGYTLDRVDSKEPVHDAKKTNPSITKEGWIKWDHSKLQRLDLAHSTSLSFDGKTMAVTIPTSYHIFLFSHQAA